jgi:hypothetical protein
MQLYSEVNTENSEKIINGIYNGSLFFKYSKKGKFLLRIKTNRDGIISVWGSQLPLRINRLPKQLIFSSLLTAVYSLEKGTDPLDAAFDVMSQLLSNEAYIEYEKDFTDIFKEGVKQYRAGGQAWTAYKQEKFTVGKKEISIK